MKYELETPIPIKEQSWPNNTKPYLTIVSWVYNHVDFISESIESILIQKTNFPVKIIIHDDASTDGTREILLKYQEKYPNLFENILQNKNLYSLNEDITSIPFKFLGDEKYIALTHGDDYWIDQYKLQKQVDFLERNITFGLVGTASEQLENNKKTLQQISQYNQVLDLKFLTSNWVLSTSTLVFRSDKIHIPKWIGMFKNADYALILAMALRSNVYFLSDITSVYRKHAQGISNQFSEKNVVENVVGIINSFINDSTFNIDEDQKKQLLEGQYNFVKKTLKGVIIDELTLLELHFILKDRVHDSISLYEFESEKVSKIKNQAIKDLKIREIIKLLILKMLKV
jgi:glycosyltransferase involved in cell wall biosynthesis